MISTSSRYALQNIRALMRCVLLRGACLQHARPVGHFDGFLVDTKVATSSHAINLSEALQHPERSFGGTTDSKASSFTAGSTRVYISVICVFAPQGDLSKIFRCL